MSREGRKITYACEMCRKRKARCSGVAPCSFCQKHSFSCVFDRNRQRRGPRGPRQKKVAGPTRVTELSPTEPQHSTTLPEEAGNVVNSPGRHIVASTAVCLDYVTRCKIQDALPSMDTLTKDEQFHLFELFETHANNQQFPVITFNLVQSWIKTKRCPEYLLLAIYACGARYSSRKLSSYQDPYTAELQLSLQSRHMISAVKEEECLAHIFAYSVLGFVEFRRGDGAQAWLDIAAARALIGLCRVRGLLQYPELAGLESSTAYVDITTAMYSIGHPLFSRITSTNAQINLSQEEDDEKPNQTCKLLQLACKIQDFWAQPASITSQMRHWDHDSKFMDLKHELDVGLIRQPDDLRFSSSRLMSKLDQGQGAGEYLLWPLVWHCGVILLNRVFLPILPTHHHQREKILSYPGAPNMFIEDRVSALESSAAAVSIICSDVIASGCFFMPPFLGYCALQSSLVHLNTIRRQKQIQHTEALENLKINCTLLTGMRKVYKPAELWLNQLMGIVSPDIKYAEDHDNIKPFKDYFSRFADMQEVPYLEMDFQKEMPARGHSDVNTTEVTQPRGEYQRSISENGGPTETDAWISQYRLDLEDQMSDSSEINANSGERTAYDIQQLSSQLVLHQNTQQGFLDNTDDLLISRCADQTTHLTNWQSSPGHQSLHSSVSSSSVPLPQDDWAYASMDLFLDDTTWDIETALYSAMPI